MRQLLWISPYAPYDTVAHAGGKIHNYYLKFFQRSGQFHITLLTLCLQEEEPRLDSDRYGIDSHVFVMDRTKLKRFQRRATSAWSYVNPYDRFCGTCLTYERTRILRMLRQFERAGKCPEIVLLHWTFSVMLVPVIRERFPEARVIAIEEDVTFQGYRRKWENASGIYKKWFWKTRYQRLVRLETEMLQRADLIVTNNPKDTCLLEKCGLSGENIYTSAPYFDDYTSVCREVCGKDILFLGAMSRPENYLSALWFIDHVLPLLHDPGIRFVVVGNHPDPSLMKRRGKRVIVTGYVEDLTPYFQTSMCLAAPLVLGAGIKTKILEAMSAGLPVLTNHIGIEGIHAQDERDYFHCTSAEDYARIISEIIDGKRDVQKISSNARKFITDNYDLRKKTVGLLRRIEQLFP